MCSISYERVENEYFNYQLFLSILFQLLKNIMCGGVVEISEGENNPVIYLL